MVVFHCHDPVSDNLRHTSHGTSAQEMDRLNAEGSSIEGYCEQAQCLYTGFVQPFPSYPFWLIAKIVFVSSRISRKITCF